jgi:hypothetical protein
MIKTKIFFDTEFTGLHQNTTLISIGLVASTGKTFYAEFTDYDQSQVDDWVKTNVIEKLYLKDREFIINGDHQTIKGDKTFVLKALIPWLMDFESIIMWSDCLSYDWMLFCQLFGHAFNIPENVYYIPMDISTLFWYRGIDPDIQREGFAYGEYVQGSQEKKHTALWDAKVIRDCWNKLTAPEVSPTGTL